MTKSKKRILYPIIHENKYWQSSYRNGEIHTYKGSLLSYSYNHPSEPVIDKETNIEWIDNKVFDDILTFTGYGRGRSSAVMHFSGSTGAEYNMFLTDTEDLIKAKDIVDGRVKAQWTFCKRGRNYGIRLADIELGK
ncbi:MULTISPECIES: hypothetical protein [unclassified Paenibacillus]|uniref:hypothetical protein n=1 Tax=unclassified Paenibacillus TaxID=185978 RepID=UPI00020D7842|nr:MULTISPECIES: hypothetical protein [unclassified Paenibacillus]EGL19848.1 hypothetical protein HMPREF9413_4805 [Paenibacillus sp. HGF7]EPD81339.1 hypothetical protein HMPREF1207_05097 [Paenibacillus sp. HGH0039]